jgi:hypothetical protein
MQPEEATFMSSAPDRPASLEEIYQRLEAKRPGVANLVATMKDNPTAAQRKQYAENWLQQPGLKETLGDYFTVPSEWTAGIRDQIRAIEKIKNPSRELIDKMQPFLKGGTPQAAMPPPTYISWGHGFHGGFGPGVVGWEWGSIWTADNFGRDPEGPAIVNYQVDWLCAGIPTGIDLGVSIDVTANTIWFGDINQIKGLCNGVSMTGAFGGGLTVTLYWTGSWGGVGDTSHPIGVGVVCSFGIEEGLGVFYNASWTQFL